MFYQQPGHRGVSCVKESHAARDVSHNRANEWQVEDDTFEAANVLDAELGPVHVGAVDRLQVGRIEPFEPFAALERCRRVGRIAHVAADGRCFF